MFVAVAVLSLVVLSVGSESTQAKTIMVDDSGGEDFETIQDAVDNAEAGDTIRVYEGTYYETLWLNKTLTLIGNGSRITTIDGEGKGNVVNISADSVHIVGFTITNSSSLGSGIFSDKDHGTFEGLKVTRNYHGIHFNDTKKNTIAFCEVVTNTDVGINLVFSNETRITMNDLAANEDGIALLRSSHNQITENTARQNKDDGIDIDPGSMFNQVANNTIFGNLFGIVCTNAPNNTIADNTVQGNGLGIGIYKESHNNTITDNTATTNFGFGIATHSSNNSLITGNIIEENGVEGTASIIGGFYSNLSSNITLSYNSIRSNTDYGLYLEHATDITITHCSITDNKEDGIVITGESGSNQISWCNIYNNTDNGVSSSSDHNTTVNASWNWWGKDSGPHHPVNNSAGGGDNVTDHVDFDNWLSSPYKRIISGDAIKIHYISYLIDGTLINASFSQLKNSTLLKTPDFYQRNSTSTLDFEVNAGEVIPGLDEEVRRMELGENRTIIIPPEKGPTEIYHPLYGKILMYDIFIVEVEGESVGWVDEDSDGDGFPDDMDWAPSNKEEWWDHDGDGTGDNADPDDDNDTFPDILELESGSNPYDKEHIPSGTAGTVSFIEDTLTAVRGGIEKELSVDDDIYSGDILVSKKTAVLKFSSEDIDPTPLWEGALYIFIGPETKIGVVYLEGKLYISGYYGNYYIYMEGEDKARHRAGQLRGDGPATLTSMTNDPLIDSALAEDHYSIHTEIGELDVDTFFRINVDSNYPPVHVYEGSTAIEGDGNLPRTIDEHHGGSPDHQTGEIEETGFTTYIGVTEGDVETRYEGQLEYLSQSYHIPDSALHITVIPDDNYDLDISGNIAFSGGSDAAYSYQWTVLADENRKDFEVRTILGEGANDQFSVHGPARTGFTSSEEKYYDFSITYQEDDKVETFEVVRIGTVPGEEGTFKVTDFSKLSDPSGEPVSYTTQGTTVKISTGEDGEEIQERWEEADKKKDEGIVGMLTAVYFYVPNYYFIVGLVVLLMIRRSRKKKKQERMTQETLKAQEQKAASSSFAEKYPQFSQPAAQPEQPTRSPTAQLQHPPTGEWNCPACGKVVKGGFDFCMFCGGKRG